MPLFIALMTACGGDAHEVATASLAPSAGHVRLAPMPEPEALLRGIEFGEVAPEEIQVEWPDGDEAEPEAVAEAETASVVDSVAQLMSDVGARWKDDAPLPEPSIQREPEVAKVSVEAPEISVDAPPVEIAKPEESGPPAGMSVDQVIRRYASQTQYCHETAKERYSQVEGRVSVAWNVVDGQVQDVEIIDDTTGDPAMASCVARKVRYWRFPAGMDAEVEHPFVFQRAL